MSDDLIASLKAQLESIKPVEGLPDRIRLSVMVPRGMVVQAPYERDGSVNLDRTVDDGGPQEFWVNPEDFDELVEAMTIGPPPLAVSLFGLPVIDERKKPNKQTGGES